jgi:hypothetical protein
MNVQVKISFGDTMEASELKELARVAEKRGVSVEELVVEALRREIAKEKGEAA